MPKGVVFNHDSFLTEKDAIKAAIKALEKQHKYEKALKLMAEKFICHCDNYCDGCVGCNGDPLDIVKYFKQQAGLGDD